MHKTIVAAAAVLLTGAGVCLAQPPGITREMIERSLPLEGAPLAEPGPYQVTSEAAFGSPGHHVFRPTTLDAFPKKDTLPVMVWGNGGCAIDSTRYSGFLTTIASHGFLVLGTVPQEGAARRQENADDVRAAIDWAEKENERTDSPLEGKIASEQSRGHGPVVRRISLDRAGRRSARQDDRRVQFRRAESDPRRSGGLIPTPDVLPKLHGPVLLINGSEPDFMMATSAATFDLIEQLADVLRRPAQRRPHGDRLSSGRRRIRQCRVELAAVDVQRRQESRQNVRRQELRSLHEFELGREIERDQEVKSQIALAVVAGCAAAVVSAQSPSSPSSSFPRGSSMQNWQNPGIKNVLAKCRNPPKPFSIPIAGQSANANAAPPDPVLPRYGRNSRCAGRGAVVESRLVVGGQ